MARLWENIANYMDDEKREQIHAELAPCTKREFLARYLELDPEFENVLASEFSICDVDDLEEYRVLHIGGNQDGKVVAVERNEQDAIELARDYDEQHNGEDGYIGVMILDIEDHEVENWI